MRGKRIKTDYKGIYELEKDKKYEVRVSLGWNPIAGKYDRKGEVFDGTLKQAIVHQAKMADQYTGHAHMGKINLTMSELARRYFDHLASIGRAPHKSDKHRWNVLEKGIGSRQARSMNAYNFDLILDGLSKGRGVKPQTVNRYHALLSGMLEKGVAWGVVPENEMKKVSLRTPQHVRRTAIQPSLVGGVLESVSRVDFELYEMLHLTCLLGCRRSELCGLQVGDWNDARQEVTIQRGVKVPEGGGYVLGDAKAHNIRTFKVHDTAAAIIRSRVKALETQQGIVWRARPTAFLFSPDDGRRPFLPDSLSQRFDRIRERMCPECYVVCPKKSDVCPACGVELGVKLTMHNLRRFATTAQLRAGVNPAWVQYQGGWHDQKVMLGHYADFHAEDAEASHAALTKALGR